MSFQYPNQMNLCFCGHDYTAHTTGVTVVMNADTNGNVYGLTLNGTTASFTSTGGGTTANATGLKNAINANATLQAAGWVANSNGATLSVSNVKNLSTTAALSGTGSAQMTLSSTTPGTASFCTICNNLHSFGADAPTQAVSGPSGPNQPANGQRAG